MSSVPPVPQPRRPRTLWRGGAWMGAGLATFAGTVGDNREHAHHALQLAVADAGEVAVWIRGRGELSAPAVLLDADVVHCLRPGMARLLYVDRESDAGRMLSPTCVEGVRCLSVEERLAVLAAWPCVAHPSLVAMLAALGQSLPHDPRRSPDDRVQQLLDALVTRPSGDATLASLAAEAALSPSRFRHVVKERVGMPLRPYLRWLRLRQALLLAASGQSLTRSAQDAGFADAAHLTRTMQRHFGVAPSDVIPALRKSV